MLVRREAQPRAVEVSCSQALGIRRQALGVGWAGRVGGGGECRPALCVQLAVHSGMCRAADSSAQQGVALALARASARPEK